MGERTYRWIYIHTRAHEVHVGCMSVVNIHHLLLVAHGVTWTTNCWVHVHKPRRGSVLLNNHIVVF